jgi:hypothetical protein
MERVGSCKDTLAKFSSMSFSLNLLFEKPFNERKWCSTGFAPHRRWHTLNLAPANPKIGIWNMKGFRRNTMIR